METLVTKKQMQELDRYTSDHLRLPSIVLMERAALCVVKSIEEEGFDTKEVLVLCGGGNNGGDGFAAARLLAEKGVNCRIYQAFDKEKTVSSKEAGLMREICINYGIPIEESFFAGNVTLIIDALFGTGLNRALNEEFCSLVRKVNLLKEKNVRIVSIDIASGIDADNGHVLGDAVKADLTVTFQYRKPGQLLYPGALYTGSLVCADIGIVKKELTPIETKGELLTLEDLPPVKRKPYSNKGSYGKVLIAAGSKDIGGCALLAARSCFRCGAGMVRVFTHRDNRQFILSSMPEAMLDCYEDKVSEEKLMKAAEWADVLCTGPGILGGEERDKEDSRGALILDVLLCRTKDKPLLIDADGIYLLKRYKEDLRRGRFKKKPLIITPHIGEMASFLDLSKEEVLGDITGIAGDTAGEYGLVCVLKDARTVTADPEGRYRINLSGNNGMATAGMGDTLSGIIAGLWAQGMEAFDAASYGAYIHGLAGDLCLKTGSRSSLLASDTAEKLSAFLE